MRNITTFLSAALVIAALLCAGCSKPWSHEGYSGETAKEQFKTDSLDCQVIAGEEFPLSKLKQQARYKACMNDRGWQHDEDNQGIRFETKPR